MCQKPQEDTAYDYVVVAAIVVTLMAASKIHLHLSWLP